MTKTITVTGTGTLSVKPDTIVLTMDIAGNASSYDAAIALSAEKTEGLKTLFAGLGFDKEQLKTGHFSISPYYESYQEGGVYLQRFAGYEYRHSLKLSFDAEPKLLGECLGALAASSVMPEFYVEYTVKDPSACKNLLLQRAVADSKEKAAVLAEAAGVSLGEVCSIDYSWGELNLSSRPFDVRLARPEAAMLKNSAAVPLNIDPEDIRLTDTVTVVWALKNG